MKRGLWLPLFLIAATAMAAAEPRLVRVLPSIQVLASDLEALEDVAIFEDPAAFLAEAGLVAVENFESVSPIGTPDGGGLETLPLDKLTIFSDLEALKIAPFPISGNHERVGRIGHPLYAG